LRFWNDYIEKNDINYLIQINVPHIPTYYICYALCKEKGIKVATRLAMVDVYNNIQNDVLSSKLGEPGFRFRQKYEDNLVKYRNYSLNDIPIENNLIPYVNMYGYGGSEKSKNQFALSVRKKSFLETARLYISRGSKYAKNKRYKTLLKKVLYAIKTNYQYRQLLQYAQKESSSPLQGEKYFYFPLHYQPEATTVPLAGIYANQELIIDMISKLLPSDYYLYVKEHPVYWKIKDRRDSIKEWRNEEFYRNIKQYKNVRLINYSYNSEELIGMSAAVVTATGTAGLESLTKGKNVLAFGNAYYRDIPGVYYVSTNENCRKAINEIVSGKSIIPSNKDIVIYFHTLGQYAFITGFQDRDIDVGICLEALIGKANPRLLQADKTISLLKEIEAYEEN
jgi:hypothetical protein